REEQLIQGILYVDRRSKILQALRPAPLVIRLHESTLPDIYADRAHSESQIILVLPGLTAQAWAQAIHGTESLNAHHARTFFFVSGFLPKTGGLLMSTCLPVSPRPVLQDKFVVLFSYEFSAEPLINALANASLTLMVCGERTQAMVRQIQHTPNNLRIVYPHFMSQESFDALLCQSELNFVRGEDSLVQAIGAGKPFLWQIYPQDDLAHLAKLSAFLSILEPYFENPTLFENYRWLTHYYNGLEEGSASRVAESVFVFIENLATIKLSVERFRGAISQHGTLIDRLIELIKTI
ncbi:MAG: elongation factor P maturation arginine rhamnosyltransferase EarP, partial [Candidatus Margulisiibacteriota bacterium]